jgi:rubrerythrin
MAKTHFFDVSLAVKYGPIESIILTNLCWWTEKNRENGKHYVNGRYWVYNSIKAFENLFPYLNGEQIRRTIDKLRKNKALLVGKFNKIGYDRTLWYSVSDEVLELYRDKSENAYLYNKYTPELPGGKLHLANSTNANDQTGNTDFQDDGNIRELPPFQDENPADLTKTASGEAEPEGGKEEIPAEMTGKPEIPGENSLAAANLPECPNGKLHLANSPNANAQTVNSIWQKQQIDLANSTNRFVEFAKPIPDINLYKPAVALKEKEAAASPFFQKISKEMIRETLTGLNRELIFDPVFYKKTEEYMEKEELDIGYLSWIYRECIERKPEKFRGMYYSLIFKSDLSEIYKNTRKEYHESLMVCPVCGREHSKYDYACPECNFQTENLRDNDKIDFERRFYHLDENSKERYVYELAGLFKTYHGDELQEQEKGLKKKYHLLE